MAKKPNVLFILVDDMGYGDFGIFGDGSSQTPNLDRLAAEGVCLSNYHTASPVCAPSRAAIMTGRYPHRSGVIDTLEACGTDRLALKEMTMADLFKRNGYHTGLIGKWHLGALDQRYHPKSRGFDHFTGFRGGWSDYYDWTVEQDGAQVATGEYLTDFLTDDAIGYIQARAREDQPFFLHLTYNAPHFPYQAPEECVAPFKETGKFNDTLSTLYGMIQRMDEGVGRILAELKNFGAERDTIVIFTSDNGPDLGGATNRYNCDLHGMKSHTYEGGIKVPALIRWPGKVAENRVIDGFMHGCDWLPTIMEACGIGITDGLPLDGVSVWLNILGEEQAYPHKRYWQWTRYQPLIDFNGAARDGDMKLVKPYHNAAFTVSRTDGEIDGLMKTPNHGGITEIRPNTSDTVLPDPLPPELYDLGDDPLERNDLSADLPEMAQRLLADFDHWFEEVEAERAANVDLHY